VARNKDRDWNSGETNITMDGAQLAVLMDIRDELKAINRILHCSNTLAAFYALPNVLKVARRIDKRLASRVKLKGGRNAKR